MVFERNRIPVICEPPDVRVDVVSADRPVMETVAALAVKTEGLSSCCWMSSIMESPAKARARVMVIWHGLPRYRAAGGVKGPRRNQGPTPSRERYTSIASNVRDGVGVLDDFARRPAEGEERAWVTQRRLRRSMS